MEAEKNAFRTAPEPATQQYMRNPCIAHTGIRTKPHGHQKKCSVFGEGAGSHGRMPAETQRENESGGSLLCRRARVYSLMTASLACEKLVYWMERNNKGGYITFDCFWFLSYHYYWKCLKMVYYALPLSHTHTYSTFQILTIFFFKWMTRLYVLTIK